MIYCAWSAAYAFEYSYLIFWNVFWSLAPVIAIGLFDRLAGKYPPFNINLTRVTNEPRRLDDDILMEIPELYRYGREGYWFSNKIFTVYMLDAVYQSVVIYFMINFTYFIPTARPDGYDVAQYEFTTVMIISGVLCVNIFNGLNTSAWTGWVFFSVFIGIILIWAYTVRIMFLLFLRGTFTKRISSGYIFYNCTGMVLRPCIVRFSLPLLLNQASN